MTNKKKNLISLLSVLACSALVIGANGFNQSEAKAEDNSDVFFVRSASLRETDGGYAEAVNYKTVIKQDAFVEMLAKKDGENVVKGENGNWEVMDGVKTYTIFAQTSTLKGAALTLENGTKVETTAHWFPVEYEGTEYLECIAYVDEIPEENFTSDISVVSVVDVPEGDGEDIYSRTVAPLSLSDIAQLAIDQEVTTEDKVSSYVNFKVNYWVNGIKVSTEQKKLGNKLTEPEKPTAAGKWFYNQWLNKDGTVAWNFAENTVNGPVNLYADMRDSSVSAVSTDTSSQIFSATDAKVQDEKTQAALASEIKKTGFVAEIVNDGDWPWAAQAFIDLFCANVYKYRAHKKAFNEDNSDQYLVVRMFMPEGMEWNDVYYSTGDFNNWGKYSISMSKVQGGQWVNHVFNLDAIYCVNDGSICPWYYLRQKDGANTMVIGGKTMNVTYISDVYFLDCDETLRTHSDVNGETDGNSYNSIITDAADAMLQDATTQAALQAELAKGSVITEIYKADNATWFNNFLFWYPKYDLSSVRENHRYIVIRLYMRKDMLWAAVNTVDGGGTSLTTPSAGWVDYYFDLSTFNASINCGGCTCVDLNGNGTANENVIYFAGYRFADSLPQ